MADRPIPPGSTWPLSPGYLAQTCPDLRAGALAGPLSAELIAGGKSNLTYRVAGADPAAAVVLRRPPLGHVLPTAHDMAREYRVIAALYPTGFPVPVPLHLCADPDVIGAPFYLMSYVDGRGAARRGGHRARSPPRTRRGPATCWSTRWPRCTRPTRPPSGLADFGRPDGYLERQVRRWYQQWERSKTRDLPTLERGRRRLARAAARPAPAPASCTATTGSTT